MDSPRPWEPASEARDHGTSGVVGVQHEGNCQAGMGTDKGWRGADTDQCNSHNNQKAAPSIGHSISPGVPYPETEGALGRRSRSQPVAGRPSPETGHRHWTAPPDRQCSAATTAEQYQYQWPRP